MLLLSRRSNTVHKSIQLSLCTDKVEAWWENGNKTMFMLKLNSTFLIINKSTEEIIDM